MIRRPRRAGCKMSRLRRQHGGGKAVDSTHMRAPDARSRPRGDTQRFKWAPTHSDTADNTPIRQMKLLAPFGEAQRLAVYRDTRIISVVAHLLFLRRPTHIARFVVAAAIREAIKALTVGSFAHIGKKIVKELPTFADFYAKCAVPFVARVSTPTHHAAPTSISGRSGITSRVPVPCLSAVSEQTAAGSCRIDPAEISRRGKQGAATIASAAPPPPCTGRVGSDELDHYKTPHTLSDQVKVGYGVVAHGLARQNSGSMVANQGGANATV